MQSIIQNLEVKIYVV